MFLKTKQWILLLEYYLALYDKNKLIPQWQFRSGFHIEPLNLLIWQNFQRSQTDFFTFHVYIMDPNLYKHHNFFQLTNENKVLIYVIYIII